MTVPASPKVLIVSSSDCSGGSGFQSDIKTLTSLQVYASTVITALTSQDTVGLLSTHELKPEFVCQQIEAVLSDMGCNAIKIGKLPATIKMIRQISATLDKYPQYSTHIVVDSGSLTQETDGDVLDVFKSALLCKAYLLITSVQKAELLLNMPPKSINNISEMTEAARKLAKFGPQYILINGETASSKKQALSVLCDVEGGSIYEIASACGRTTAYVYGAEDVLSAAVTGGIAKGLTVLNACESAITYARNATVSSFKESGQLCGPVNHFHSLPWSPFCGKYLIDAIKDHLPDGLWESYMTHPFVKGIADGTLPTKSWIHYLKQDYLYLQNYARAAALAAYKCRTMDEIETHAIISTSVTARSQLHLSYMAEWGVTKDDVLSTPQSVFGAAYTGFIMDRGSSGDVLQLRIAMAPCAIGYAEIGRRLYNDPDTKREGNPYWKWICRYAHPDNQASIKSRCMQLHNMSRKYAASPARFRATCKTFEEATRFEIMFWEMGFHCL